MKIISKASISISICIITLMGMIIYSLNGDKLEENIIDKQLLSESDKKAIQKEYANDKKEGDNNYNLITYKSLALGLEFDMPNSWSDKYFIQDNGVEIDVYMKHEENFKNGCGLLFIITSDLNEYDEGKYLDKIGGIDKKKSFKGKTYNIGGPLDFRIHENDPLKDRYINMINETREVLSSLRAI